MTAKAMTPLCAIDDIAEGAAKAFEINDMTLFVVKKDDHFYAYKNSCPHLGVELEYQEDQFLDQEGKLIQCSTHGALFLIEDGSCISGPCMGDELTTLTTTIEDGVLFLVHSSA